MKGMQFQFLTKNNREYRNHKMGNPEKLATLGTQDDENQNKNNPEKLATLGTQDDENQNKKNTIQNIYTALIMFYYFVS